MAFQDNNSVAKLLECPLCLDTFKKPKVLPCQHSFCLNCIYKAFRVKTAPPFHVCPICNAEVKFEIRSQNRTNPLTEADLNVLLPNNFTLMNLAEIWGRSSAAPNPPYENQAISESSNVATTSTVAKPKPFPRQPAKKPAPRIPSVVDGAKSKRLSVIPEKAESTPPQPLRRLPNQSIKVHAKLEPELMDVLTPKKFLVDSKRDTFVIFFEANSGVRKYDRCGTFVMKFACGSATILDFVLESKCNDALLCLTSTDDADAESKSLLQLQTYNTDNGQRLKSLKSIDCEDGYRLITRNRANNHEYVLAGSRHLAVYSKKDNSVNRLPNSTNLPDLNRLVAIDCTKTGNLYLLFDEQPGHAAIVHAFSLATCIAYALPILSIDFCSPRSISIAPKDFYICDRDNRCVSIYRKTKPEITKADNAMTKAHYYNWKPVHVIVREKSAYILDAEKKTIYVCDEI